MLSRKTSLTKAEGKKSRFKWKWGKEREK